MSNTISSSGLYNPYDYQQQNQETQPSQTSGQQQPYYDAFTTQTPPSTSGLSSLSLGSSSSDDLLKGIVQLVEVLAQNPQLAQELGQALSSLGGGSSASSGSPTSSLGSPSAPSSTLSSPASPAASTTGSTSPSTASASPLSPSTGGAGSSGLSRLGAPATYDAQTHAAVVANTPNYNQVSTQVMGYLQKMADPDKYAALSASQKQEMVDSAIDCSERYLPQSVPLTQRCAMVLADVGAESSFQVGTAGPNGQYGDSVGVQQVTPSIWGPKYAQAGGTQNFNVNSIWGNMHLANWAISSMGQNPATANEAGGTKTPSWWTGLYYWAGQPQVGGNGSLPTTQYRTNQANYLAKVGLNSDIMDSTWT